MAARKVKAKAKTKDAAKGAKRLRTFTINFRPWMDRTPLTVKAASLERALLAAHPLRDLTGTMLALQYLRNADLRGASIMFMPHANLERARLEGVDLTRTFFAGASFAGVDAVIDAGIADAYRVIAFRKKVNGKLRVFVRGGCRCFPLDAAIRYWDQPDDKPHRRQLASACWHIKRVAELRGWL